MVYLKGLLISFTVSLLCVALPAVAETVTSAQAVSVEQVFDGVNINKADAAKLAAELKGVGVKRAEAIIAYRRVNGPFTEVNQLMEIKGISTTIIKQNREKIRL